MLERHTIMQKIKAAYDARQRSDKVAMAAFFAPGATYRMVGKSHLLGGMAVGPVDAVAAIGGLIDQFAFPELRHIDLLIDGHRAAVHLAVRAIATASGEEVDTELLDLWTFDDAGQVTDITEFADTAQVSAMLPGARRG